MLLLAALVGCGSDSEPNAEAAPPAAESARAKVKPAPAKSDDPIAKLARAVGDGKPGAAVEIRYEIADRPQVGVPTQVHLVFVPSTNADALDVTMTGMDGITIAGDLKAHFDNVEIGKTYEHTFSLLPDRSGVYYIAVAVTTTLNGVPVGRTFSIPFVAGDKDAQRAQKAEPQRDASGQAVQPMKAEERIE